VSGIVGDLYQLSKPLRGFAVVLVPVIVRIAKLDFG